MRKFKMPLLIGLASFFFGAACLFAFLKLNPERGVGWLGVEAPRRYSAKPITPALQLAPPAEEEAQAAPVAPRRSGQGAPPFSAFFDKDDEDLLSGEDPFAAMRKMHRQIEEEMRQGLAGFGGDSAGGSEITAREDDSSVSYEIKGAEKETLSTSVKNGFLTVSGETKREQGGMRFQASFHRRLSLPPYVDASKMETITDKDKIVLRFPKKQS